MSQKLTDQFHSAMLAIYDAALQLKPPYRAKVFLRMVQEHGGKGAADKLLATGNPSSGFTELYLRGKDNLQISVEYLVLQNPWRELFTEDQLEVARKRLKHVNCAPPPGDE
ncbi:MAG: hypothetical protein ACKN9T_12320 [Candidatus Methylumidiphilus sp.]